MNRREFIAVGAGAALAIEPSYRVEEFIKSKPAWHLYARDSFAGYRQLMRPKMQWGWWVEEVANELQYFYDDMIAGKRPILALMCHPQVGKSWTATDFASWLAGKCPDKKIIFASYSDALGIRTANDVERAIKSDVYREVFSDTRIDQPGWMCNSSLIEFVGHQGSFRTTTVAGAVNGMELHLGIIDDPVKGRREANSKTTRDMTWSWLTDDFMSRFAKDAGLICVMTRWHVDDLLGRLIERMPNVRVLRYPAIAEHDLRHFYRGEYIVRHKGEALFPELKPLDFLVRRKKILTAGSWEALYQQHPIIVGGGIFPIEKLRVIPVFDRNEIRMSVRGWDKAGLLGANMPARASLGIAN